MYLENNKWVAGEHVTIADTTIYASMSGIFVSKYMYNSLKCNGNSNYGEEKR